jgi:hypothetical protein
MKDQLDNYYCAFCYGVLVKYIISKDSIKYRCEHFKSCPYVITLSRNVINEKEKTYKPTKWSLLRAKQLKTRTDERPIH